METQRWANHDDETGNTDTKVAEDEERTSKSTKAKNTQKEREAQRENISPTFKYNLFPIVCLFKTALPRNTFRL